MIGYHQEYLNENYPEKVVIGLRYLFAIQILYNLFFNVPKFAILLLYNRVFPPPLTINKFVRVMMVFLVLQTIANTLAEFLICGSHFVRSTCASRQAFYVWGTFPNIISDVIILVLPMTIILRMHMENRMKVGLAVTFFVGSLYVLTVCLVMNVSQLMQRQRPHYLNPALCVVLPRRLHDRLQLERHQPHDHHPS